MARLSAGSGGNVLMFSDLNLSLLKLNNMARLSASSEETLLMRKDEKLTMWLDCQQVQEKIF